MKLSVAAPLLPALAAGARPARARHAAPRGGVRGRGLPPTPAAPRPRDLMEGATFSPLTCNAGLSAADCDGPAGSTLSALLAATPPGTAAAVPCGACAVLDAMDGSVLDLPDGLDVRGMLRVPSVANATLVTPHIFVQGVLRVDPPADPANTVRVRLVGTEDQFLIPHDENAASSGCDATTGCNVGKKSVVVAGGQLDIRALPDETCPTWTTLTSVVPPAADGASASTGCPFVHDLVSGDGTFASRSLAGFDQVHAGWPSAQLAVTTDDDGNSHLRQTNRNPVAGIRVRFDTTCADPPSASNNVGVYRFHMRYRAVPTGEASDNGWVHLKLVRSGSWRYAPGCPAAVDNEWQECDVTVTLTEQEASAEDLSMEVHPSVGGSKDVDYDDISLEAMPRPHRIRVADPHAAACFGARPGSEVMITNSKSRGIWDDQVVLTVDSVDAVTGEIDFGWASPLSPEINPNVDPDMASEVVWLSRSVVFEAEGDGPSDGTFDALHGGHLMIFHTPDVAQHIEGIEFKNFGQQGILGRYPVHFHKSLHVAGSVVRKNSIRESKQRCIVIHGTHDVVIEENVSFDHYGHCYILEDSSETNNTFVRNLGARTRSHNKDLDLNSNDDMPSTIWITNPQNHFIGNICAGSTRSGIWFQLDSTKYLSLGTFKDNTSHSNSEVGIKTYPPGFMPPDEALFEGIRSYHNQGVNVGGLFIHGTRNVRVKNAFFAHNTKHIPGWPWPAPHIMYFGNGAGNSIEGSSFVGSCGEVGISFDLTDRYYQLAIHNSTFTGYVGGCDAGSVGAAFQVTAESGAGDMPILSGVTVDSNEAYAIDFYSPFEGETIYLEDPAGEYNPSGLPGFFVNNQPHMTAFIDEGLCSTGLNSGTSHGLFCQGVCLRRLLVDTGCCYWQPDMNHQMVVTSETDPSKTRTFEKYPNTDKFDVILPSDEYNIHFVLDGQIAFPPVTLSFHDEVIGDSPPSCSGYITSASLDFEVDFAPSAAPSISLSPTRTHGMALWQVWNDITGCQVSDLTNSERYQSSPPDRAEHITDALEIRQNTGQNYGSRLMTYIRPPVTGSYTFWIASDDGGELWLSSNTSPEAKEKIAEVESWTHYRSWNEYPSQESDPIHLEEGQEYYLEALHKEGGYGDHLSIAWALHGSGGEPEIIKSQFFGLGPTSSPTTSTPSISPAPTRTSYNVVCGATDGNCKSNPVKEANIYETHEVRCCADSYLGDGWQMRSGCSVWGESEIDWVCHRDKIFAEAVAACSGVGARLCTQDELLADCTRWTGCGHDSDHVWSSTPSVGASSGL